MNLVIKLIIANFLLLVNGGLLGGDDAWIKSNQAIGSVGGSTNVVNNQGPV
jgi:hypothetical protein